MAIAINAFPLYINPILWLTLRFVCGICLAGLMIVAESWLNNRATNATRGSVFSIYMMATFLALGSSQFLLAFADIGSNTLFSVGAIIYCLALIPVAVTSATNPEQVEAKLMGFRKLYAISPVAVVIGFSSGVVSGALYGTGTIYAVDRGFDLPSTSLFMTALILGGLFLQYPIGYLSDRFDRRLVITGTSAALAALCLLVIWLSTGPWWSILFYVDSSTRWPFLLTTLFIGGIAATLYPLSVAYANDYLEPHQLVSASGGLVLTYGLGAIFGPTLSAAVMTFFGSSAFFGFIAGVGLLACLFTLYRLTQRHWVPIVEKETYVAMPDPTSMPIATSVDPRTLKQFGPEEIGPKPQ